MSCYEDIDFNGSNSNKRRFSDQLSEADVCTVTTATQAASGACLNISRASSVTSINAVSSASSAHNTDDEDSDALVVSCSSKERRREAHTQAEQLRRDAIKRGYEELQEINPLTSNNPSSPKLSKATILQKALDLMHYLDQQEMEGSEAVEVLQREVTALNIIKKSYEQMALNCQDTQELPSEQLSNQHRLYVFQQLMESLFVSFDACVDTSTFEEMSFCVPAWLENHCKPAMLKELVINILSNVDLK